MKLGGVFQYFFFTPIWGRFKFDYCNIFHLGWNHQLGKVDFGSFLWGAPLPFPSKNTAFRFPVFFFAPISAAAIDPLHISKELCLDCPNSKEDLEPLELA